MSKSFLQAVANRRTYYGISNEKIVPEPMVVEIVESALKHTPSAFNSQNSRVLVLFGAEHDAFWSIAMAALRAIVPAEKFAPTEEKINSFAAGYGTVLFFEDMSVVENLQTQFPGYAVNFPIWSGQASGMLQFVVWAALEAEGLGASLQHYSPLVDEGMYSRWDVPRSWKLTAQMPFGKPTAPAGEKTFLPLNERVKIYR
ncbi:MAG: nitroreductase family protein [Bacillota bacterium]